MYISPNSLQQPAPRSRGRSEPHLSAVHRSAIASDLFEREAGLGSVDTAGGACRGHQPRTVALSGVLQASGQVCSQGLMPEGPNVRGLNGGNHYRWKAMEADRDFEDMRQAVDDGIRCPNCGEVSITGRPFFSDGEAFHCPTCRTRFSHWLRMLNFLDHPRA
jgi:hypothetical protein